MNTEVVSDDHKAIVGSSEIARVDWISVGLFILLTFGTSWSLFIGLRALGVPLGIRAAIGMFGPAVAALLVRLLRREGFADAGLRLTTQGRRNGIRMYIAAYVVSPLVLAAGVGLALLIGYQHWALSGNLHTLGQYLAKAAHQPSASADHLAQMTILVEVPLAFTLAIPFNMIFTFGEEFGWRGFLLPRLAPLGGVWAAIITGIVWGVWHAPLIVLDGYNYPGHPWLGIGMMVVFTVALGIIFAWLRFRSGSVWPSTLAHAAINAQAGFAVVLLSHGDSLFSVPIGIIGLVPMLAFATWLAATGRLRPETRSAKSTNVSAE